MPDPVIETTPDPVDRIFALLAAYRHGLDATACRQGCPIGNLALEVSDSYPAVRPKIDLNFRNWSQGVGAWLEEASDRFPDEVDLEKLADFILVVMEGGIMLARARDSLEPFDRAVAVLKDYFSRLLEAKKEKS